MPAERPDPHDNREAARRPANKFATTSITNELADALTGRNHTQHNSNATGPPLGPAWAFIGYTTATPPGGAADFADQRYHVIPVIIQPTTLGQILALAKDTVSHDVQSYVVENLSERPTFTDGSPGTGGTHGLVEGSWVYVYAAYDANGEDSNLQYFTFTGGGTLPVGQYVGMFLGVVADNTEGHDYPFAVNTV